MFNDCWCHDKLYNPKRTLWLPLVGFRVSEVLVVYRVIMRKLVLVLFFVISALAQDNFESSSVQLALKIYDDCSKMDGLSVCLKKKAVTFIDRLGRMDKLALSDGIVVHKTADAPKDGPAVTEDQLDQTLPRSSDAKDEALTEMLMDKIGNFVGSRSIEVALPTISVAELIEEGKN